MDNLTDNNVGQTSPDIKLDLFDKLRLKFNSLILRPKLLWSHIKEFSLWFEYFVAARGTEQSDEHARIILIKGKMEPLLIIQSKPYPEDLSAYESLWTFLRDLNIKSITLDMRLEHNQIEDILNFLFCYRKMIANRNDLSRFPAIVSNLFEGKGIHLSCTDTVIREESLIVEYSYCTLAYSHIVHWFENRHKSFSDHRTLFRLAPKAAVGIALLIFGPSVLYSLTHNQAYLGILLAIGALTLFGIIYLLIMTVGSMEYDNEEKAYRLGMVNNQLHKSLSRIDADIAKAKMVQELFIPSQSQMPLPDRIEWASKYFPANEMSGDYFDAVQIDKDRIAILFTDVCGHGMAAAFITAVIKTAFQSWLDAPNSLSTLARHLNEKLCCLTPIDSFAAAFLAVYDTSEGIMEYVNCGHCPEPRLVPAAKEKSITVLNEASSMIMGVLDDLSIETSRVALASGDIVVCVSDGITECQNQDDQQFEIERLEQILENCRNDQAGLVADSIYSEAKRFCGNAVQSDDQTILVLRVL